MVETATAIAIAAVASSVAAAGTAIYSGQQAQAAGKAQRLQYEMEAAQQAEERQAAQIAAKTAEADRLTTLNRVLGAQAALRGARGLTLDSPTSDALITSSTEQAQRDLDNIVANSERADARLGIAGQQALLSGEMAEQRGNTAAIAGYSSAFQSLAGGAQRGYNFLNTPSKG